MPTCNSTFYADDQNTVGSFNPACAACDDFFMCPHPDAKRTQKVIGIDGIEDDTKEES